MYNQTNTKARRAENAYLQPTGFNQVQVLFHFIHYTLPRVQRLLHQWRQEAELCGDEELRRQALNSIAGKAFHCQGGAVFAVPCPDQEDVLLRVIVAYQTLCDYLDNLCDRAECLDGTAFRELHVALTDALTPQGSRHPYYQTYPCQNDGGYIDKMVDECRQNLQQLPSYHLVQKAVIDLAGLYIELQVRKHIDWSLREKTLIEWAESKIIDYPGVLWNEYAAATGSTLAIFALLGLAVGDDLEPEEVETTVRTYFPWICGLHILLDYFIDQEEDRAGGDLNFTFYYPDNGVMLQRLKDFVREAHNQASQLPQPYFAKTVIEGLLAMYFSDKKVEKQGFQPIARELIKESGHGARQTYYLCSLVRKFL
ncbi:MAG: tetraprenyl-beta-curcumene synthase family protein [Syntrophomonadaceae bacterium]|nr:tetraprenyl-beta-curcumene synthase family protein [Syntrophomonadaceae bacterium]